MFHDIGGKIIYLPIFIRNSAFTIQLLKLTTMIITLAVEMMPHTLGYITTISFSNKNIQKYNWIGLKA